MSPLILSIFAFIAVLLAVGGAYSLLSDLFFRDQESVKRRIREQFQSRTLDRARKSLLAKDFDAFNSAPAEGNQPVRPSLKVRVQIMLNQSGLQLGMGRLVAYCAGAGALAGLAGGILQRNIWVALVAAVAGAVLPVAYVNFKRNARIESMRGQLSDAFDLMARILRAGQSMPQAMQAVSKEFLSPIAEEFAFSFEQQNLGLAPEISLRGLAARTGLIELNIFVVAVLVQRQVGGNLAEILEKLARVVRDRYRIRGVIKGLTAEGRLQAMVLMALPPFMFMTMLIVNREYTSTLLTVPALLGGIVFFQLLGGLWIRKIVNFDF